MNSSLFIFLGMTFLYAVLSEDGKKGEEEDEIEAPSGYRDPTLCEVCKYLAVELQGRLDETGKNKEVIETGHGLDTKFKKRKEYKKSELRLIEAVQEPHVCDRLSEYNVHAERKKSLRYAKGQSETMRTLHGLVDKGVKVELGIPYEMWDHPSAEITSMQKQCYKLVEDLEDDIEDWYYGPQDQRLIEYLCRDRILKGQDPKCLYEEFVPKEEDEDDGDDDVSAEDKPDNQSEREQKKAVKGDTGTPTTSMPPTSNDSRAKDKADIEEDKPDINKETDTSETETEIKEEKEEL